MRRRKKSAMRSTRSAYPARTAIAAIATMKSAPTIRSRAARASSPKLSQNEARDDERQHRQSVEHTRFDNDRHQRRRFAYLLLLSQYVGAHQLAGRQKGRISFAIYPIVTIRNNSAVRIGLIERNKKCQRTTRSQTPTK